MSDTAQTVILWLIPGCPLAAAVLVGLFGRTIFARDRTASSCWPWSFRACWHFCSWATWRRSPPIMPRPKESRPPARLESTRRIGARRGRLRVGVDRKLPRGGRAAGRRALGRDVGDGDLCQPARHDLRQRIYARRPGLPAVLRRDRALRVFHVHAGDGPQLCGAVCLLGSRRSVQLPADRLLVRAAHRLGCRGEGVRDEPHRGCGVPGRHLHDLADLRQSRFSGCVSRTRRVLGAARPLQSQRADDLLVPVHRGVRQVGPISAAPVVARRDGRPHPGERPDPRRHDGHRRRLPGRPLHAAVCAGARCPGGGGVDRRHHGPPRCAHRARRRTTSSVCSPTRR